MDRRVPKSVLLSIIVLLACWIYSIDGEDDVKYATPCEVCKLVTKELEDRLKETGKSHDVVETGYSLEGGKKTKKKYQSS